MKLVKITCKYLNIKTLKLIAIFRLSSTHSLVPVPIRDHPFMTSTRRGETGSGSGERMWTGGGGPAPCGRPHRKLKLESTDVILSSSHAQKLASFFTRISSLDRNIGNFSAI